MTSGAEWQDKVGRNWAQEYARTDRAFSGLTERLLARIAELPGERVLDVGCGAGELSLAIARARSAAQVVGLDVSADLVAAARDRATDRANVCFELGDAARWSDPGFAPDLLVSRHGVMFFDDPSAAFENLRRIAAPDAQLAFSCFRAPRENPWAAGAVELLGQPPGDPEAPGPFAFADPQRVETILSAGGWEEIDFAPVDFAYVAGAGDDPAGEALALFRRIGPAARALAQAPEAERPALESKLADWIEDNRSGDLVAFAAAAWIVTARRRDRATARR